MENNPQIPICNIYYMLSYAYQTLSLSEYKNIGTEAFQNVEDLYVEILILGIPVLIRGGLLKDYIGVNEYTAVIRGKIDMKTSLRQSTLINRKLVVTYDHFSVDTLFNQILKATLVCLTYSSKVAKAKKRKLYGFLPYFSDVMNINLNLSLWQNIHYNRQNIRYQFLLDICRFLYEGLLLSEGELANYKSIESEKKLATLFEKFVYAFYQKETSYQVSHPQIPWKVDNNFTEALPIMQTDIVLQNGEKTLIIDTKFYSKNMASRFESGAVKQLSANLYQIFTYVNNWQPKCNEQVGGLVLYAKTLSGEQPNHRYEINGHQFSVLTLDLSQNFKEISRQLISIAATFFAD